MNAISCPTCGTIQRSAHVRFCRKCGKQLAPPIASNPTISPSIPTPSLRSPRRTSLPLFLSSLVLLIGIGSVIVWRSTRPKADLAHREPPFPVHVPETPLSPEQAQERNRAVEFDKLGSDAFQKGQMEEARQQFQKALDILNRVVPNSQDAVGIRNNLAVIMMIRGDLAAAEKSYWSLVKQADPKSPMMAGIWRNLGSLAYGRGLMDEADAYYHLALEMQVGPTPLSPDLAQTLNNMGNIAQSRGDLKAAENDYKSALSIVPPNSLDAARTKDNQGVLLLSQNPDNLDAAEALFKQAYTIRLEKAPHSKELVTSCTHLANIALRRGKKEEGAKYYADALQRVRNSAPASFDEAFVLRNSGQLLLNEGKPQQALPYLEQAVRIIEQQRNATADSAARMGALENNSHAFESLLLTQLALKNREAAFLTLERSRARGLSELLFEHGSAMNAPSDDPATQKLWNQRERLRQARRGLSHQLSVATLKGEDDRTKASALGLQIADTDAKLRRMEADLRPTSSTSPPPLEQRRPWESLDAGTVLLAYAICAEETILFVVTHQGLQNVHRIPVSRMQMNASVTNFQAMFEPVGNLPPSFDSNQARELYRTLILPAQAQIDMAKRVLICPDGPLHRLPFAALLSPENLPVQAREQFMGLYRPLHSIVSLRVYQQIKQTRQLLPRPMPPGSILVVTNPDYSSWESLLPVSDIQTALRRTIPLSPLTDTDEEVKTLKTAYGAQAVLSLNRKTANRDNITKNAPTARMLLFACHGLLDDTDPLSSALAVAPLVGRGSPSIPGSSDQDDGLLFAYDILSWHLHADLVVLSACQTGLGGTAKGGYKGETRTEGVVGMTRAWQLAGARSVVPTLWQVDSASTGKLVDQLFTALAAGQSKDEALRAAQKAVMLDRDHGWGHPYYWAGLVLVGDWQ